MHSLPFALTYNTLYLLSHPCALHRTQLASDACLLPQELGGHCFCIRRAYVSAGGRAVFVFVSAVCARNFAHFCAAYARVQAAIAF